MINLDNQFREFKKRDVQNDRRREFPVVRQPQPEMQSKGHETVIRAFTFIVGIGIVVLIGTMSCVLLAVADTLRGTA